MCSTQEKRAEIRNHLAQACRILYMEGLADFNLGHASSKIPGEELVYIKPKGLGLEEVKADDIVLINMEGDLIEGKHPLHGETPIHTEIYKARKDVGSIVHVHPLFTTAFSAVQSSFRSLNQDGVLFPKGAPTFKSPELIVKKDQGQALAEELGQSDAILLKNHGIVTVGNRIQEACLNALFFERALRLQAIATIFGETQPISEDTALSMYADFSQNPGRYDMIWNYLLRKLQREGLLSDFQM